MFDLSFSLSILNRVAPISVVHLERIPKGRSKILSDPPLFRRRLEICESAALARSRLPPLAVPLLLQRRPWIPAPSLSDFFCSSPPLDRMSLSRMHHSPKVVGTFIAALVYLGTAWWLMETIPGICDTSALSSDNPWTCPGDHVFYDASVIWGLIGPRRIFGELGTYGAINWFFLGGAIAPLLVWIAHKAFPRQGWIRLINMPVLIGATGMMPPATAVNYTSWIIVGFISGFIVFRYRQEWYKKYNYVLSGALDAGLAFMAVLLYFCLGLEEVSLNWWGNNLDGCPLASCPTAKGVFIEGCPPYY